MTATIPEVETTADLDLLSSDLRGELEEQSPETVESEGLHPLRTGRIGLTVALATMSSAWMMAHLFHSVPTAVGVCLLGVGAGVGPLLLAARRERAGVLAYIPLPLALLLAELLAKGGNLFDLIKRTMQTGGLQNPPIPLTSGWRALLVILTAFVAAGAMTLSLSARRPKLAVGIPAVVTLGATLLQPKNGQLIATLGAVVLLAAALALAYGADLADKVDAGAGFETRRLLRGVFLLAACVAVLALVAQSDLLFPSAKTNTVIPPRKPPHSAPLPPDLLLFTVTSPAAGPWRLGVLDSYGQNAFLLPSVDSRRVKDTGGSYAPPTSITPTKDSTYIASFQMHAITGQTLPAPGGVTHLDGLPSRAAYDPDTGLVSLKDKELSNGLTYTVTAIKPPSGKQLEAAPPAPADLVARYTQLPPAPPGVRALLAKAPARGFDRLQYLRLDLLSKVVAAGGGGASDIVPADVDKMLAGGKASPYQIVAAQVMLARWAGIPARVGFGFYGGTAQPAAKGVTAKAVDFHPADGSAWLEAYFQGYDWVPIVGQPQKAQPSLSKDQKKKSTARQTAQLALSIYIPIKQVTAQFIYEVARYYVLRVLAVVVPIVLLLVGYPFLMKGWRRRRRSRWADKAGLAGRVMVAYAELRDACYDLNIGAPRDTPLEFLTAIEPDAEHDELAWAFTRIVWGDLARDLHEEDVLEVEAMSRSVLRRIKAEQPFTNRFVAAITRTSLRDPWTSELPNVWWTKRSRPVRRRREAARAVPVLASGGAA